MFWKQFIELYIIFTFYFTIFTTRIFYMKLFSYALFIYYFILMQYENEPISLTIIYLIKAIYCITKSRFQSTLKLI